MKPLNVSSLQLIFYNRKKFEISVFKYDVLELSKNFSK